MTRVNTDLLSITACLARHKLDNPDSQLSLSQVRRAADEGSLPVLDVGTRRFVHYETFNEWLKGDRQVASENKLLETVTVGELIKMLSKIDCSEKVYVEGANPTHRRGICNVSLDYPGAMIQFHMRYDEQPYFREVLGDEYEELYIRGLVGDEKDG